MADSRDDSQNNPAGTNEQTRSQDAQLIAEADIHESERDALKKAREAEIAEIDASGGEAGYGNLHFGEQKTNEDLSANPIGREANEFVTPSTDDTPGTDTSAEQATIQNETVVPATSEANIQDETNARSTAHTHSNGERGSGNVETSTTARFQAPLEADQQPTQDGVPGVSAPVSQPEMGSLRGPANPDSAEQSASNPKDQPIDGPQADAAESNSAPNSLSFSNTDVDENDAGAVVATLSSTDPDAGDSATYSLSDDTSGLFEVVGNELRLKGGVSLNHENQDSYEVTLMVTDGAGASFEQTVTINVADVNEGPTSLTLSATIVDENDVGAVVATLSSTDVDEGDTATYTLSDDASGLFEIVGNELKLKDGTSLDHEGQDAYTVSLTVTDSAGASFEQSVTINVADVNEGPTSLTLSDTSVDENDAGATVATLSSTDVDDGDIATYALSEDSSGLFEVVGDQVKLKDGITLNHEGQDAYELTLTVTDNAGASFEQTVTINVADLNEGPTQITLSGSDIDENATGAIVGTLATADVDDGDVHSYDVSDGRFEVIDGNLKLKDGISLDHETAETVDVTVTATDSGGFSTAQEFSINVADVNEVPSTVDFISTRQVNIENAGFEDRAHGDQQWGRGAEGWESTGSSGDWNPASRSLSAEASEGDNVAYVNSGKLAQTLGETFSDSGFYTLSVDVGNRQDINSFGDYEIRIFAGDELIGTADGGAPGEGEWHTVSLDVSASDFPDDFAGFGENLRIELVRESGGQVNFDNVQLTVTDPGADMNVPENHPGAQIAILSTLDPDDGDRHSYTVSDDRFEVIDGALKLKDGISLNHEEAASVDLVVTATDSGGLSVDQDFTVQVSDVNETPSDLGLSGNTVVENDAGAVIGALSVSDVDDGESHVFTVSDDRFEVVGGNLKLKDGVSLNHENAENVDVTVTATDSGGLATEQTFSISVGDENEAPTDINFDSTREIQINNAGFENRDHADQSWGRGAEGWESTGSSGDWNPAQRSLAAEASEGDNVAYINSGSLSQTLGEAFSATTSYELTVDVGNRQDVEGYGDYEVRLYAGDELIGTADGGAPDEGGWETVSLQVNGAHFPEGFAGYGENIRIELVKEGGGQVNFDNVRMTASEQTDPLSISENDLGAQVGAINVVDEDQGDSHTFVVSDDRFEVVDGALKLKDGESLDHEAAETIDVTVTVTDSGGLSTSEDFTINVADVNEAPVSLTLSDTSVDENDAGAIVATLSSTDIDEGDSATYTLSEDASGLFEVVGNDLKLKDGVSLDHENQDSYEVTLTVTDDAGASFEQTVTIDVADVNEGPTSLTLSDTSVDENDAGATVAILSSTDVDEGDSATYVLSGDSSGLFDVVGNELKLKDGVSLDHEAQDSYEVSLTVTDNAGESFEQTVTIDVADVNDAPTSVQLSSNSVGESVVSGGNIGSAVNQSGVIVGDLSISDQDGDAASQYQLTDADGNPIDHPQFEIVGNQVVVKSGAVLDYESTPTVDVYITATDSDGASTTQSFTLELTDSEGSFVGDAGNDVVRGTSEEDNISGGDGNDYLAGNDGDDTISGDDGNDRIIGGAGADELHGGAGNDLIYADGEDSAVTGGEGTDRVIVQGDGDFTIDQDATSVERVDGGAGNDQMDATGMTERATQLGNAGDDTLTGGEGSDVQYGGADNDVISGGGGNDIIRGDAGTDRLTGGAGDDYIDGGEGNDTAVFSGDRADYTVTQLGENYFRITDDRPGAPDGNDRVLNVENFEFADGTVPVEHIFNEAPSSLSLSDTSVDENDAGATVATLSSTDVDDGDGATYALSEDTSGLFEVVGNELKLKDGVSLDHEGQDSYEVSLTVTDDAGASFEQTVTIDVADVNEGPTSLTLSDTSVDENDAGATVATLSSTDVDDGDGATYALSEDTSGLFEVVGNELKLKDGVSLDHEGQDSYEVSLTVTDDAGASFEQTVTIDVNDVNEATVVGDVDLGQSSEDTSIVITEDQLLAQSHDPEGAALSVTDASVDPAHGSLADNGDGSWTFTPTQDLAIDDVPISFDVSDGSTVQSAVASIDVVAVADAPTITLGAVTQEELGESNTVNSGFEVEGIDVSGSSSDWIGSLGDWETTSDAIEVKQETLADGSTNQFIELNDDAIDYFDDATNIVRTIETEDGATYTVNFENAARPGYDGNVNEIEVVINGEVVDTFSADGTGSSAINWESNSVTFVGDGTDATVEFRASGDAQNYGRGMYLDDVVITEELPVGHAAGDGQIALPDISVAGTDSDGSETISTVISDIPDGFIISDGTNSFTSTDGADSVDISDWAQDQMTVTPSDGFTGEVSLNVTATSTDGTDQTSTTEAITVNVEPSDDVLTGGAGDDTIAGGGGNDTISGEGGNDALSGGSGDDVINGDGGDDTITGGTGDDVLNGGDGSDVFVYAQGDGSDVINGGVGGGWTDAIEIEGGISSLGNFGTDWTVELTEGSVTAQDSDSITFSDDAAGSITFSDGTTVEFENLEQII